LVAFWANAYFLGGVHVVPATMVAVLIGGLLGYLIDRGVFRPLRGGGASLVAQLVITIGLSFLLRNFFQYLFGERPRPLAFGSAKDVEFWIISINPLGVTIIIVSVVVLVAVGIALQTTRLGKAMRAVADNRDLAESSGIDVQRVISLVWFFGGGLAALGGTLVALDERAKFDIGFRLLLLIFAGVTLGGLGTAFGALVGSVVVGIFINVSTVAIPTNLKNVGALAILIAILMLRPQGIFGRAERVG
jgi:branched-chain amino acid transport system permease protein